MKTVTLSRLFTGTHGTFGRITVDGKTWWAVEPPKTGAHPCIPAGTYPLSYGTHHAGKPDSYPCYWVNDVPGRSAIQIHVANLASQLQGCIAPGLSLGMVTNGADQAVGVMSSGDAFRIIMKLLDGAPATLTITENL